ncbi:MAG: hypothetical protein QG596_1684 [Actinomycetota bacterium]|jgi:hypothetical protein|nr:hypothetical protein [Actinomycetota bacterium]
MGILDEAIREHLELKRQHGADENELQGLESEAFGPADRPDATDPSGSGEAETQIISPGSSITVPAGEGDQLDKVFQATREEEAAEVSKAEPAAEPPSAPDATFAEHPIPEPPAPPAEGASAAPEVTEAATVESPEAKPAEPAPAPEQEGDAGDMLEAERHHLSGHPTEHYDVDAAIAEEDEIDVLSESSLSDELDRALDSGEVAAAGGETVEYQMPPEDDSGEIELDEPDSAEIETGEPDSGELEAEEEDSAELLYQDAATEDQPVEEDEPVSGQEDADSEFFDQDDPLEATPDFLEETPEHDRLWFEQKEPKDFDFGD